MKLPRRSASIAFVATLTISLPAPLARAAEPVSYAVNARIHPAEGVVVGAMHVDVAVAEGDDHLLLWLYPDRLAVAPAAMDSRSARWIYPGEVDRGGIAVSELRVDGRPVEGRVVRLPEGAPGGRDAAGADLEVPIEAGAARRVEVRLRFVIELPRRHGRLGRLGDGATLAAPWYPLLVGADGAWHHDVPHRVTVSSTEPVHLVVGGVPDPAGTVEARGPFVPVLAVGELHRRERDVDGVRLRMLQADPFHDPPPATARGEAAIDDLVRIDVVSRAAEALADVLATMRSARVPVGARQVTLVAFRSREELATTAPGLVLYSDRLYEILPAEQTLEFHHRALRRALFRHLLAPVVDRVEAPVDRPWAADLRAVLLTDLDDARRHGRARTPEELIGFASFHPAVDQLLYAPQIAFVDVYFGAIEEPDPFHAAPVRWRSPHARGRRILESARDVLSEEQAARFVELLLGGRMSARRALDRAAPGRGDRLAQWLVSPTLEVNYRLGEIDSVRAEDGRWRHRIEVIRDGAERVEPVEVLVEDDSGYTETLTWDGDGGRAVLEVTTPEELDDVVIDPRQRLPQSPRLTSGHPRGDDATAHPWKPPLLRAFGLNLALSERAVEGFVDFAMRRRYDLEHTIAGVVSHRVTATTAGARYIHGVGPKRHSNSRVGWVSGGVDVDRLHGGFIEGEDGGWRGSLALSTGFDTRSFFPDPREGSSLVATGQVSLVRRDGGQVEPTGSLELRGSMTFPFGLRNALVLVAGAGWTFGDALPAEHQHLGGRYLLRGFESNELVGDGRLWAVAEHRWTAVADMAVNLLHLAWLREIQLALFGGGGVLLRAIEGEELVPAAEAGAGVRFHYEYAGVQPAVLSIDVAVPLTRDPQRLGSDGVVGSVRSPVGVHVAFDQFF